MDQFYALAGPWLMWCDIDFGERYNDSLKRALLELCFEVNNREAWSGLTPSTWYLGTPSTVYPAFQGTDILDGQPLAAAWFAPTPGSPSVSMSILGQIHTALANVVKPFPDDRTGIRWVDPQTFEPYLGSSGPTYLPNSSLPVVMAASGLDFFWNPGSQESLPIQSIHEHILAYRTILEWLRTYRVKVGTGGHVPKTSTYRFYRDVHVAGTFDEFFEFMWDNARIASQSSRDYEQPSYGFRWVADVSRWEQNGAISVSRRIDVPDWPAGQCCGFTSYVQAGGNRSWFKPTGMDTALEYGNFLPLPRSGYPARNPIPINTVVPYSKSYFPVYAALEKDETYEFDYGFTDHWTNSGAWVDTIFKHLSGGTPLAIGWGIHFVSLFTGPEFVFKLGPSDYTYG